MTQKQLITANNAELEKHKQDILSLPMADDVKNGKYVWGKYENSFHIMNPTFKAKCVNYNSLVIMESSFDFSQISNPLDFIVGFKSSNGKYSILKGVGGAYATDGSYQSDLTAFDGTKFTGFSVTNCCFANNEEVVFVYDGEKILSDKEKSFLAYTVSDLETAYPDGGGKDGYWWERVKDVVLPEGVSKISVDSFTLSTDVILSKDYGSYYIPHSLKEKPKKAYIIAKKTFYQSDEDLTYFEWKDTTQKNYRFIIGELGYSEEYVRLISNGTGLSEKGYAMIDAEKLILYWIADNYQTLILRGGNTYTLITMA